MAIIVEDGQREEGCGAHIVSEEGQEEEGGAEEVEEAEEQLEVTALRWPSGPVVGLHCNRCDIVLVLPGDGARPAVQCGHQQPS